MFARAFFSFSFVLFVDSCFLKIIKPENKLLRLDIMNNFLSPEHASDDFRGTVAPGEVFPNDAAAQRHQHGALPPYLQLSLQQQQPSSSSSAAAAAAAAAAASSSQHALQQQVYLPEERVGDIPPGCQKTNTHNTTNEKYIKHNMRSLINYYYFLYQFKSAES